MAQLAGGCLGRIIALTFCLLAVPGIAKAFSEIKLSPGCAHMTLGSSA